MDMNKVFEAMGMVEGKEYRTTPKVITKYKIKDGDLYALYECSTEWTFCDAHLHIFKNIEFKEIPQAPKEYTLEELNERLFDINTYNSKIKSVVTFRAFMIVRNTWMNDFRFRDDERPVFSELLGKWVIVEGE